jgi:PAS domain S-box-containing protein
VLRHIAIRGIQTEEVLELPLDGPGITVRAVKTGETQLVPDVRLDKDYVVGPVAKRRGVRLLSELAVPIKVDGEVLALINVESQRLNAFTEEDRKLLEILAEHVALAIRRLRREEQMLASRERYQRLLEESGEPITIVVGTKYVYLNPAAAKLLGFDDPSQLIGKDILEFIAPEQREMVRRRALGRQRGERHPSRYEVKIIRPDGTERIVELLVSLIEYRETPVSLSFLRDITEKKRMEERLEALHKHAMKLTACRTMEEIAVMTLDTIERVLGFSRGGFGVVRDGFLHFIHVRNIVSGMRLPIDGPGITVRAARTGETQLISDTRTDPDYLSGDPDNPYQSLSELDVPIKVDGEVVAVVNVESERPNAFSEWDRKLLETLAEHVASAINRLRYEETVRREKEFIERLIESVYPDGFLVVGEGRRILRCNKAVEEIWGYSREELVGETTEKLFRDREHFEDYGKRMYKAIKEKGYYISREETYTRDGRRIIVEVSCAPIPEGVVAIVRDITELEEERLKVERARELERLRSNFIASISHSLKTPLTSILGFSDLMLEGVCGDLTEEQRESLSIIRREGEILLRFINDLLDLAKRDAKMMKLKPRRVSVRRLVEEIVEEMRPAAFMKRLSLTVEVPEMEAELDAYRIKQVLRNLLENAIKFTERGGVHVAVKRQGEHLLFSVSDTGMGIPEERIPYLFDRYAEINPEILAKYGGTGLGLRICKEIIDLHGGEIWVESRVGEGSTFHFRLPIKAMKED